MRDLLSWNIHLGRVAGIQVRLHAFFFFLCVIVIAAREQVPLWYGLSALAVLFFSVVWHEVAHCVGAIKSGGSAEVVLLWPLGGLVQVNAFADDPQQEWPTAISGVLANLIVCTFVAPILLISGNPGWLEFNPLVLPPIDQQMTWQCALGLVFWINWILALVNLLPAFPFDGARLFRAWLWPRLGYRSATLQLIRVARFTALVLLVTGLVFHQQYSVGFICLAILAILVFFAARQEMEKLQDTDSDAAVFGYDFSQGYTSLDRAASSPSVPKATFLRRWLDDRRENRIRRKREVEELEDLRVDDVLVRLHEAGIDGLSTDDRALLKRVSARYRNRHRTS